MEQEDWETCHQWVIQSFRRRVLSDLLSSILRTRGAIRFQIPLQTHDVASGLSPHTPIHHPNHVPSCPHHSYYIPVVPFELLIDIQIQEYSAKMSTSSTETSPLTLISATPSPFARMNRIALTLKGIPFELQNEIPWQSATETPKYNPLEKLPILLLPDGRPPVYDSAHIQEYIVRKYADKGPKLITDDVDLDLQIRQIVVLSEGCMDAIVIARFEGRREKEKQSQLWLGRQNRKIDGAMRAFDEMIRSTKEKGKVYLVGDELTIADIAVVCTVGFIEFAEMRPGWKSKYEVLAQWFEELDQRKVFAETRPVMFNLSETVV